MKDTTREIGFVSIYIAVLRYKKIAQKKWKQIVAVSFLAGVVGVIYAWSIPKTYIAELTFAIEDKSSSGMYSSIASQFGIDLSKGDDGAFKGDNIIELYKSKSMIERTLLSTYPFREKQQLLIDRYLEINGISIDTNQLSFSKDKTLFTRQEDSLLHLVSNSIIKNGLEGEKLDKKLAFTTYRFKSTDELFAKVFIERLTQIIKEAYLTQKTKKIKANIAILEMRIDSVRNELNNEMSGAASAQDQNQNAAVAKVKIPILKRQMNIQLLTTLYGELVKNIELSKMSLVKEEPLIEIIDSPTLPLKFEKKSRLITGITFFIIMFVLSSAFVIAKELYTKFKLTLIHEELKNEG